MPIAIETKGIHPSTGLCFEALQWLHDQRAFHNILDMGCGNGILSVAAASVWDARVLAVDVSEKALSDATKNIENQEVKDSITLLRSDGFSAPLISQRAPYDLIICNMLAEFSVEEAQKMKKCLAPDGMCILAGILAWKAETVKTVYSSLGFEITKEFSVSPWLAAVLCH
jgi:ribosomal protein L11 methyltransferase